MPASPPTVTVDSFRRNASTATSRKPNSGDNSDGGASAAILSGASAVKVKSRSLMFGAKAKALCSASVVYFMWVAGSAALLVAYLVATRMGVFPVTLGAISSSQAPLLSESTLETVVRLPIPPGNVAVSDKGRVFFTFHPEYHQDPAYSFNVGEVKGPASFAAFPPINFQRSNLKSVLSLRVDHLDRLWLLDFAWHGAAGRGPQLLCFQLLDRGLASQSEAVLAEQEAMPALQFVFPPHVAGLGSFLNDFVVDRDGRTVYIADTSLLAQTPALIVFRSDCHCAFRVLHAHPQFFGQSAQFPAAGYAVGGFAGGLVGLKIHLDSIALTYSDSAAQLAALRKRARALLHQTQTQLLRPRASSATAADTSLDGGSEALPPGHASYSERRLVLGALTGTELLTVRDVNAVARLCRQSNASAFARHPQDATRSVDPHRHPLYAALQRQLDAALRQNLRRASATKPVTDGLTALSGGGAVVLTDVSQSALTVATLSADDGVVTGFVPLVRSPRLLQWPDGLSQAADGSLFVTASRLQRRFGRAVDASADDAAAGGGGGGGGAILRLAARHVVGAALGAAAGGARVAWAAPVAAGQ
eukprot:gene10853-7717_t